MKAASGETETGGETRPWPPMVDGLSLDMLCVLDLGSRGDATEGDRAISGDMPAILENIAAALCSKRYYMCFQSRYRSSVRNVS